MNAPKRVAIGILLAAVFIVSALEYVEIEINQMPWNASVLIDPNSNRYFASFCAPQRGGLIKVTVSTARDSKMRPDDHCRNAGAFEGQDVSVLNWLLIKAGLAATPESRWSDDGSWNW